MTKVQNKISQARAAFDFHVAATLALRLWTLLAGSITVLLVPLFLTRLEQGYYFTFASVLALQVFFELGLNYVLVQFTATQMASLHFAENGLLSGDAVTLQRLGALVKKIIKIYVLLAILFFCFIGAGGSYFFASSNHLPLVEWLPSWILLTVFTAGNLYFSPFLAIAEGTGRVGQVARLRTFQSIVGYLAAWICMASGYGLWAMPLIVAVNFLGTIIWWRLEGKFISALRQDVKPNGPNAGFSWRREIFPFHWRIAVSWMSGYLIFQMFNPVIFKSHGPIEAGAVGLALSIFGAITTLSMSWVNARAPDITKQLRLENRAEAKLIFMRQFNVSFWVNCVLISAVVAASALMRQFEIPVAERLPELSVLVWIALAAVATQVVFALAVFMRAHGEEPLMAPSIVTGIAVLAVLGGTTGRDIQLTMALYAGVQVVICLPWVATLFFNNYWTNYFQLQK